MSKHLPIFALTKRFKIQYHDYKTKENEKIESNK